MKLLMNFDEQVNVVLGAFRYYIGRQSYAVETFTVWLNRNWYNLDDYVQTLIKAELEEAFAKDDLARLKGEKGYLPLGMDCDRAAWLEVRSNYLSKK